MLLGPHQVKSGMKSNASWQSSAGIFKQSKGARNQVGMGCRTARQSIQPAGIGSLESILGLLKSLKIRALVI
jgi:hypothetical protein